MYTETLLIFTFLLYTLCVYGLSWLLTQSRIFNLYREFFNGIVNFIRSKKKYQKYSEPKSIGFLENTATQIRYLANCIVCTSVWVGLLVAFATPESNFLFRRVFVETPIDMILLSGYNVATVWFLASLFGDAD